jgi:hypothetical protein
MKIELNAAGERNAMQGTMIELGRQSLNRERPVRILTIVLTVPAVVDKLGSGEKVGPVDARVIVAGSARVRIGVSLRPHRYYELVYDSTANECHRPVAASV